jgi:hypothetical protein
VKLGKYASGTCAVFSEAYGGEAMKNSSVSEWHIWFKEGHERMWKMMEKWSSKISQN